MSVKRLGSIPQPERVSFPPGGTTLVFTALATPSTAVNVKYRVTSPPNVSFDTTSGTDELTDFPVSDDGTDVRKDVIFNFTGKKPVAPIDVTATVSGGGSKFDVSWKVRVAANFSLKNQAMSGLDDPPKKSGLLQKASARTKKSIWNRNRHR